MLVKNNMRNTICNDIYNNPGENIIKKNSGELVSKFTTDVNTINETYIHVILMAIPDMLVFSGSIALMIHISPILFGIITIISIFQMIIPGKIGTRLAAKQRDFSDFSEKYTSTLSEHLQAYETMRSFGQIEKSQKRIKSCGAQAVSFIENELAKTVIDKNGQNDAALNIIHSGSHGFRFDWKRNNRYRLINYYETLINKGIATPDTYSFLIENLLLEREYDKALAFIKKAKDILPDQKTALYNILLDTIKNNKTDYSEIISIGLNSGFEENYIIGSFLASRNEYSAAIACWQRAFDKQEGRKYIDPLEQMSECYILLKKYAEAININELIIEVLHTDWEVDSSKEIDEIKETIKALKLLIK